MDEQDIPDIPQKPHESASSRVSPLLAALQSKHSVLILGAVALLLIVLGAGYVLLRLSSSPPSPSDLQAIQANQEEAGFIPFTGFPDEVAECITETIGQDSFDAIVRKERPPSHEEAVAVGNCTTAFNPSLEGGQPLDGNFVPLGPAGGAQNDISLFAISNNPAAWPLGTEIAQHASVPEIIALTQPAGSFAAGDLLVYYVDFATAAPGQALALLHSRDDGQTWSAKQSVSVVNRTNKGGVVDPSIVQLPDGTLRLYFFGPATTGDPFSATGPHSVYSAVSSDGVNFTAEEGVRFAAPDLSDPDVIHFNGQWYMYYSQITKNALAISNDGLSFRAQSMTGNDVGGIPGAVALSNGVRIYGCQNGIASAVSADGITFRKDTPNVFPSLQKGLVCDPSIAPLGDGRYAIVYKIGPDSRQQNEGPPVGVEALPR